MIINFRLMKYVTYFSMFVLFHASSAHANDVKKSPKWDFKFGGRLMWDVDQVDDFYNEDGRSTTSELRRAQFDARLKYGKNWGSKLKLVFEDKDNEIKVNDAYVQYKGWKFATLTLGKAKEPFGLEYLTSSNNLLTIERSMTTTAFVPGRNIGLNLEKAKKRYTWSVGLYENGDYDEDITGKALRNFALTGRVTLSPLKKKDRVFHIGSSFSIREMDGAKYEIESNAAIHTADDILDTKNIKTDYINQMALESAWQWQRFTLMGETFYQDVQASLNENDATYTGYYLQASYFLTPDKRPYKKGRFSQVKPKLTTGAWELVTSYSFLDAEDNNDGMELTNTQLGLNYYYRKNLKLMLNVIHSEADGIDATLFDSGDAISFRAQYDW